MKLKGMAKALGTAMSMALAATLTATLTVALTGAGPVSAREDASISSARSSQLSSAVVSEASGSSEGSSGTGPLGSSGLAPGGVSGKAATVYNDPNCTPAPEHPTPVLFVHGTAGNSAMWLPTAQVLKERGYCVFAWDFGKLPPQTQALLPGFYGLADVDANARELAANVNKVKALTGAEKVDIVGHSQGALLAKKYIAQLDGADNVRRVVGAGGSFHGTTGSGLMTDDSLAQTGSSALVSASQQHWNSPHMRTLNTFPDTDPRVVYTSLYSTSDGVVTPYTSSILASVDGADVANVDAQAVCGGHINHIFMPQNPKITNLVVWSLEREVGVHAPATCGI
nr:Lipase A [Streptococcus thermophilus]